MNGPGVGLVDTIVVGVYLAAILGMSYGFARRQKTGDDYFLASRRMRGGTLAMSIMANQASAVSLVGAPAFVALREGGGLRWLQYELGLPIAMALLIVILLPLLRAARGTSIYAWAEDRFDTTTRRALAGVFLLSRGLAVGVILYASALVVAPVLGVSVVTAILVTGAFSVAYCTMGGIVADIWSDVIQLVLLWAGVLISACFLLARRGQALLDAVPLQRTETLVTSSAGFDGNSFALLPMLIGGVFLYLSYYGCDQTQAQRLLTAANDDEARRALVLNGLLRFPLVLTYCAFGLLLAGLLQIDGGFAAQMAGRPADSLVPTFLASYLPVGLRGLLLAAILAAAMSSIDSALNSLAAVTLDDVARLDAARQPVWSGRLATLGWGVFATASAMYFARGTTGVLELITQIGSLFYGPVLAVFLIGVLIPRARGRWGLAALLGGFAANLLVARLFPNVSWLWWNAVGCLAPLTAVVAVYGVTAMPRPRSWRPVTTLLVGFLLIALVTAALPYLLGVRSSIFDFSTRGRELFGPRYPRVMARPLRLEFPGAILHVTDRGNEQKEIVRDDDDRRRLLDLFAQAVEDFRWIVYQYALMTNHYHFLVELTEESLSDGMQWFNSCYAQAFNRRHERSGHLFQGRFRAELVDRESYLLEVIRYVALNPVRAKMVSRPEEYVWSGHRALAGLCPAPPWLAVDRTLRCFAPESDIARAYYNRFVDHGIGLERSPWEDIVGQIYLGSEGWVETIREKVESKPRSDEHPNPQRQPRTCTMRDVIAAVGVGLSVSENLVRFGRGGRARMLAAWLGCHEGRLSHRSIAAALRVKSTGTVSSLIRSCEKQLKGDPDLQAGAARCLAILRGVDKSKIEDLTP